MGWIQFRGVGRQVENLYAFSRTDLSKFIGFVYCCVVQDQKPLFVPLIEILQHFGDVSWFWRPFNAVPIMQSFISHHNTKRYDFLSKAALGSDKRLTHGSISKLSFYNLAESNLIQEKQLSLIDLILIDLSELIPQKFILVSIALDVSIHSSFFCKAQTIQNLRYYLL